MLSIGPRFRASEPERTQVLGKLAAQQFVVAAFDGPLRGDLAVIGRYRRAEELLTKRFQRLIGKPGQASSPVGRLLNQNANECARIVLATDMLDAAPHHHAIHAKAIVEAFPTAFLGLLIENPATLPVCRSNRSDIFYVHLAQTGRLAELLHSLLPGRTLRTPFQTAVHHDDRAAVVCSLTALCVAVGEYTAVGDRDGWIVLPPRSFIQPWAWKILLENAQDSGLECRTAAETASP
jgi:hypothetical protein